MSTEKIQKFLAKFSDQRLANLQAAAEDGKLNYQDSCNCLLHHFNGEYSVTKWEGEGAELARAAEHEFLELGQHETRTVRMGTADFTVLSDTKAGDPNRRKAMLPLIHAEWKRRRERPVDIIQEYAVDLQFDTSELVAQDR